MSATKILTVALAAMLLLGGATAVAAMAPANGADVPEEANETAKNQTDDKPENATDLPNEANETADNATATADNATDDPRALAEDANESVGPPGGLPDVVPDFVRDIHSTIDSFLSGTIDKLGDALQDVVPSL